MPKFVPYLRPWGEAGIVHAKNTSTGKLDGRGLKMMYVGASMHHSGDTYLMFHPATRRIHKTSDVRFTQKMFYRQDFTHSSNQDHPLDTSFYDMHLVPNPVPVLEPTTLPISDNRSTASDTSMPSLMVPDDASLTSLSLIDDDGDEGMWSSLPSSVQHLDPPDLRLPAPDHDDGRQVPVGENHTIDVTNV